jgi:hypothetical protein
MPNWCETTYKCVGDPKEVRTLYKAIKANNKRKTPLVKNGFGTLWLGCIINYLGGNWENYRCRGHILDYQIESDGSMVTIYQETAWCEQEGFREFIEEKFPSINVYYLEEEPGCDVYYTSDASSEYFPERYFLDNYEEPLYFETIEEAAECVSSIVGHKVEATVEAVNTAIDDYIEGHEDEDEYFYSFHEFKIAA